MNNVYMSDFHVSCVVVSTLRVSIYNGWKIQITFFPDRGSNPVRWTESPALYRVAIKAGLNRKTVQLFYAYTRWHIW